MIIDIGVFALCCFAAMAFGSNESWAMGLIIVASGLLLSGRVIPAIWRRNGDELSAPDHGLHLGIVYLPLLLFFIFVIIQTLLWKPEIAEVSFWSIHTVELHSTIRYLLLAISYASVMLVVQNGLHSRLRIQWFWIGILILGVFESLYGLIQYFGDYNFIWNFNRTAYNDMATGTFINRNHYALFMNLTLSAGIGFLFYQSRKIQESVGPSFRNAIGRSVTAKLLMIILIFALMGLAVVFSASRMGIIAMLGSIVVMLAAAHSLKSTKHGTFVGIFVLATILGLAVYTGLDPVIARFEKIEAKLEQDRALLWRDAWPMITKNALFGRGLGSFQWTYPAYETVLPDRPARYAHNDYLQMIAEVGVVGLSLLLWVVGILFRTAWRNLRSKDPLTASIGLASIGALTAIILQEITDFGFYIPGVAVMAAVIAGLNLRASRIEQRES